MLSGSDVTTIKNTCISFSRSYGATLTVCLLWWQRKKRWAQETGVYVQSRQLLRWSMLFLLNNYIWYIYNLYGITGHTHPCHKTKYQINTFWDKSLIDTSWSIIVGTAYIHSGYGCGFKVVCVPGVGGQLCSFRGFLQGWLSIVVLMHFSASAWCCCLITRVPIMMCV